MHAARTIEHQALKASVLGWLLASLLVIVVVFDPHAAQAATPMQRHGAMQRDAGIGIVAHRGAAAFAPENTLAAFHLAIGLDVDFVETDVQLTADGVPVLMHDPDVDRTTNGTGPLAAHTFEQLRALDAGSWFSPEFAGQLVPTLDEFLDLLVPAPTRALIELKGDWPVEQVSAVIDELRERHLSTRVVLASFDRVALEAVRELAPEYATILQTRDLDQRTVDYAIASQFSAICARDKLLAAHPEAIESLSIAGIGAIAYTLNAPKQWKRAAGLGIDLFVTDDPIALADWRAAQRWGVG